jgi:hypothetical protein
MQSLIQFLLDHKTVELAVMFALSEALAVIPAVKSNSIFQLVFGWLKKQQPAEEAK